MAEPNIVHRDIELHDYPRPEGTPSVVASTGAPSQQQQRSRHIPIVVAMPQTTSVPEQDPPDQAFARFDRFCGAAQRYVDLGIWVIFNLAYFIYSYFWVDAHVHAYRWERLGWKEFDTFFGLFSWTLALVNITMIIAIAVVLRGWVARVALRDRGIVPRGWARFLSSPWFPRAAAALGIPLAICVTAVLSVGYIKAPGSIAAAHWRRSFKHTCDGFNVKVLLGPGGSELRPVQFTRLEPPARYSMEVQVNLQNPDGSHQIFAMVGQNATEGSPFQPPYEAVHYNLTAGVYWTTRDTEVTHAGTFQWNPRFGIADLAMEGHIGAFLSGARQEPFLKVYSTANDPGIVDRKQAWANSTGVVLRGWRKYDEKDTWFCVRDVTDSPTGPGDLLPVPVGLLVLARGIRDGVFPELNLG